jgi:CheY-like chemotaxis protein
MSPPKKLLIIDDNKEILASIERYFVKKKYHVTAVTNGLDALKLLDTKTTDFDAVITDLYMPTISGVGVISIVKQKFPHIPVIAITGYYEEHESLLIDAQVDAILEKPFEYTELEKTVVKIFANKKKK